MEEKIGKVAIKLMGFFVIYYKNAQWGIDKYHILWYHPSKAGNVSGNAFKSTQRGLAYTGGRERGVDCDDQGYREALRRFRQHSVPRTQ